MIPISDLQQQEVADVLTSLIRLLVDEPDCVLVRKRQTDSGLELTVQVGRGDEGKLIGREGRTARSIRNILKAIGKTAGTGMYLNIIAKSEGRN